MRYLTAYLATGFKYNTKVGSQRMLNEPVAGVTAAVLRSGGSCRGLAELTL